MFYRIVKAPLEVPMMCGGSHCVSAPSQLPVCFSTEHAGLTDDELAVAGLSIDARFCDLPGVSGNTTAKFCAHIAQDVLKRYIPSNKGRAINAKGNRLANTRSTTLVIKKPIERTPLTTRACDRLNTFARSRCAAR